MDTPPPDFETLLLERQDALAWITLNRPEAMNSISPAMVADLHAALDWVESQPGVRCLAIRGAGKAFCAGADLRAVKSLGDEQDRAAAVSQFLGQAGALLRRIEQLPMPVVAAVHGLALAGGLETVLVCDVVLAADDARFGDAHARHGLIPGWGGTARLPRRIGANRAKWMMFTAEYVPAATMAQWGLVHQVVPADRLVAEVEALARRMTDKSPLGLRRMKQLVDEGLEQPLDVALHNERAMVQAHGDSHDRREGLLAFAEKRAPRFNGT
ncbi:enoyl-CoA hydratase/isomerase family protein [Hydrogenophaga sp.]|uniref:enoyl-CoA hydratase/isomerase family protein n=1 Tax=Hydrogenophaga sp. TaxID=1904254 RepID=UPI00261F9D2E|nr:enoyl-CoA hydratase/isomerase family protein [Hydrogenophaga sp.]MCW5653196.1 enoyl-CoA hydratase/isomerase family protein [Hydrogenophaga sp.]